VRSGRSFDRRNQIESFDTAFSKIDALGRTDLVNVSNSTPASQK
jgi:hypothetical protein